MTRHHLVLDLPNSVVAFLSDKGIRAAVDSLLSVKAKTSPPGLTLGEFDDYLAARGAAELTRYDYAQAIYRLWQKLWGANLDRRWLAATLDQLGDAAYPASAEVIWDEKWFATWHERDGFTLFSFVNFDEHEFSLGFSLETAKDVLIDSDVGRFRWHDNGEYEGWLVARWECSPIDPLFEASAVFAEARLALAAAEARLQGPRN